MIRSATLDDSGQEVVEYTSDSTTRFGRLLPARGVEQGQARGTVATVTHRIRLRYTTAISARDRLAYGSRIFEVVSYSDPDAGLRVLDVDVVEVIP